MAQGKINLWKKTNPEIQNGKHPIVLKVFLFVFFSAGLITAYGIYQNQNKFETPNDSLAFNESRKIKGEDDQRSSYVAQSAIPQQVQGMFSSSSYFSFQNGKVNLRNNSIVSRKIKNHTIEEVDIDGNTITSRTIKNRTIQGEDIASSTDITIEGLNIDDIDLGINTITDENFTGDWDFNSGDIFGITDITASGHLIAGSASLLGNLNMNDNLILNIGNSGTDFTTGGGLVLAGSLVANSSFSLGDNGEIGSIDTSDWNIDATGAITNATYEGLTITTTTGTFTVSNGKVLTVSDSTSLSTNSITLAGGEVITFSPTNALSLLTTGATSVTFPTSGTLYGTKTGSITSLELATSLTDETGSGVAVFGTSPTFTTSVIMSDGATLGQVAGPLMLFDDTNNYLGITGANVGIGTTSPATDLHIYRPNPSISATLRLNSWSSTYYTNLQNSSLSSGDTILNNVGLATATENIYFQFHGNTKVTFNGNGNVGIGTTSPLNKLDVNGSLAVGTYAGVSEAPSNGLIVSGGVGIGTTSPTVSGATKFDVNGLTRIQGNLYVTSAYNSGKSVHIIGDTGNGYGNIVTSFWNSAGDLAVGTFAYPTLLYLKNNGNVGIGTTSPLTLLQLGNTSYTFVASGLSFGDGDTGFYENADDALVVATGGTDRIHIENGELHAAVGNYRWNIGNIEPSATAPLFRFNSDTDTGIGRADANILSLIAGGINVLNVTAGNVGIGTTNPATPLQLVSAATDITTPRFAIAISGLTEAFGIGYTEVGSTIGYIGTSYNNNASRFDVRMKGFDSSNAVMTFLGSGNVGIGVTNPESPLHVNGKIIAGASVTNAYYGAPALGDMNLVVGNNTVTGINTGSVIGLAGRAMAGNTRQVYWGSIAGLKENASDNNWDGYLAFNTSKDSVGGETERMRITSVGNVGIGTTSPGDILQVTGGEQTGIRISTTGNVAHLDMYQTALASANARNWRIETNNGNWGALEFRTSSANNTAPSVFKAGFSKEGYFGINEPSPLSFLAVKGGVSIGSAAYSATAAPSNGMIVEGSVGIGTTSPDGKLDLRDGIFTLSDIDVAQPATGWSVTNNYGRLYPLSGTAGGLVIDGLSDTDATGLSFNGMIGSTNPTDTVPAIMFDGGKSSATTIGALGALETVFQVRNWGTPIMTMLGNGNVGIGTTAPAYKLDIQSARTAQLTLLALSSSTLSSSNGDEISVDFGRGGLAKYSGRISGYISDYTTYDGGLKFYPSSSGAISSTPAMTIISTGNVGIGTTSPAAKLDIQRGASGDNLRLIGSGASDYSDTVYYATDNTTRLGYTDWSNTQVRLNVEANIPLRFYTNSLERVTILSGGNVGIGTTNPLRKLNVAGSIYANAGLSDVVDIGQNYTGVYDIAGSGGNWGMRTGSTGNFNLDIYHSNSPITAMMVNTTSGNVGIGTTNPGAKLDVNGYMAFHNGATLDGYIGDENLLSAGTAGNLEIYSPNNITFFPGTGTPAVYFKNGGNVGIGTTAPGKLFHVNGASLFGTGAGGGGRIDVATDRFTVLGKYAESGLTIGYQNTNHIGDIAQISLGYSNVYSPVAIGAITTSAGAYGVADLFFATKNATTDIAPTEWMRITASGNVGIGVTNPRAKLEVSDGNSNIAGQAVYQGYFVGPSQSNGGVTAQLTIQSNDTAIAGNNYGQDLGGVIGLGGRSNNGDTAGYNWATIAGRKEASTAGNVSGYLAFATRDNATANAERMRITSLGNVGINNTNPESKLDITTNGLGVTQTTSSGLVLKNTTPAAAGAQQISPAIVWKGSGWETNDPAGLETNWRAFTVPVQGAALPTSYLTFQSQIYNQTYADKMVITSAGSVGIGTTSPARMLSVYGTDPYFSLQNSTSGSGSADGLQMQLVGSDSYIWNYENSFMKIGTNNATAITILANSNVGIGTTNPGYLLEVTKLQNAATNIYINNYDSVTRGASSKAGLLMGVAGTSSGGFVGHVEMVAEVYPYMHLFNDSGTGLVLAYGGNVGIGTTAPGYKLDVNGTLAATDVYTHDGGVHSYSDERLKNIQGSFSRGLAEIISLNPTYFRYKDNSKLGINDDQQVIGVMAQDIQRLIPEAVGSQNGYLTLTQGPIFYTMINAIKEINLNQNSEFSTLNLSIDNNATTIEELKKSMNEQLSVTESLVNKSLDDIADLDSQIAILDTKYEILDTLQSQISGILDIQNEQAILSARLDLAESKLDLLSTIISYDTTLKTAVIMGDIKIAGIMEAEKVKTEQLEAQEIVLGAETMGKGIIKAGEKEVTIETDLASENSNIYITPTVKLNGRTLYTEEKDIEAGKSFKVKLDGDILEEDVTFNWLILK